MRRICMIFGVASTVVCSGFVAVQNEPTAEQQFKNIKSFKGEKASDVIPAMQFMCASLKEDCEFCHTQDRASDEKEPKNAAREMIAMQRDINTKYFNGRNQVTCATCHAGHTHPVAFPPMVGLESRARRSQDVMPSTVLDAYAKAVGTGTLDGVRFTGTATSRGDEGKVDVTYSGTKFTTVLHGAKGDQKSGYDGKNVWFVTPRGTVVVPPEYASQFVKQNALHIGPSTLPALTDATGGTSKIDDKDMLVVSGTVTGEKTRASFFFDKSSGLLVRATYFYPTILGSMAQVNDFSDYQKVGSLMVPMTIANRTPDGDTITKFTSATPDSKIDQSSFNPPK
jgi:hypothetical protein